MSRERTGINRFDFHCILIQGTSFLISSQESQHHCRDLNSSEEVLARVKRDLTSNVKVSRGRVASPGAVDCHALVLALVRLLAVLNLKRSWGGRPKCHSSGVSIQYLH